MDSNRNSARVLWHSIVQSHPRPTLLPGTNDRSQHVLAVSVAVSKRGLSGLEGELFRFHRGDLLVQKNVLGKIGIGFLSISAGESSGTEKRRQRLWGLARRNIISGSISST